MCAAQLISFGRANDIVAVGHAFQERETDQIEVKLLTSMEFLLRINFTAIRKYSKQAFFEFHAVHDDQI